MGSKRTIRRRAQRKAARSRPRRREPLSPGARVLYTEFLRLFQNQLLLANMINREYGA